VNPLARVPAPHLLVGALCLGLSAALAAKAPVAPTMVAAVGFGAAALESRELRSFLLAIALFLGGWTWGTIRLQSLDRSELQEVVGSAAPARLEVTGPARTTEFEVRVPVKVLRYGSLAVEERARLDLPRGRSPPQGSILEVVARVQRPQSPDEPGHFDETAYLRRQGVHVVLSASDFSVVGQRGGLGGIADALRRAVAESLAPGVGGERRAVIAGIVVGEDEGLERSLRDDFQASGLYHLLKRSKRGRTDGRYEDERASDSALRSCSQASSDLSAFIWTVPRRTRVSGPSIDSSVVMWVPPSSRSPSRHMWTAERPKVRPVQPTLRGGSRSSMLETIVPGPPAFHRKAFPIATGPASDADLTPAFQRGQSSTFVRTSHTTLIGASTSSSCIAYTGAARLISNVGRLYPDTS
jgi:hypothetical protein